MTTRDLIHALRNTSQPKPSGKKIADHIEQMLQLQSTLEDALHDERNKRIEAEHEAMRLRGRLRRIAEEATV